MKANPERKDALLEYGRPAPDKSGTQAEAPMFLSQYLLSRNDCHRLRLYDAYGAHRVVYDLFEPTRMAGEQSAAGILHVDKGERKGKRQILILSDRKPLPPDYGQMETRVLPPEYLLHSRYRFTVTINPVIRKNASGRIEPVKGRENIINWFLEKSPSFGFNALTQNLQVIEINVDKFKKGNAFVTLAKAELTGILEVADHKVFAEAVRHGIGRGKAFGCGLLQIVPLAGQE